MTPVRSLEAADDDLLLAADRLETERTGWGGRLIAAYRHAIELAEQHPRLFPLVDDPLPGYECRNAVLERYNYRVVYAVLPGESLVVAVHHTSRRPESWHRRLPAQE